MPWRQRCIWFVLKEGMAPDGDQTAKLIEEIPRDVAAPREVAGGNAEHVVSSLVLTFSVNSTRAWGLGGVLNAYLG